MTQGAQGATPGARVVSQEAPGATPGVLAGGASHLTDGAAASLQSAWPRAPELGLWQQPVVKLGCHKVGTVLKGFGAVLFDNRMLFQ